MPEWVSESLLTLVTVIIYMILFGIAITIIFAVIGEGENPGLVDSFLAVISQYAVRLGG